MQTSPAADKNRIPAARHKINRRANRHGADFFGRVGGGAVGVSVAAGWMGTQRGGTATTSDAVTQSGSRSPSLSPPPLKRRPAPFSAPNSRTSGLLWKAYTYVFRLVETSYLVFWVADYSTKVMQLLITPS